MSELHQLAVKIVTHLEQSHMNDPIGLVRAKGRLATETGFLVSLIGPTHPDEPDKLRALRKAAVEFGIDL